MKSFNYKVTYLASCLSCAFVRIADDAILYTSQDERMVIAFAEGFCCGSNGVKSFFIE